MDPALVEAAVAAARQRNQSVAEVPLTEIARAAGISRSTLVRRLGGSRTALDDAVRHTGVDPGVRVPVRQRAIDAAAQLIADQGLGALTLEAVARQAGCAVPSLHVAFGNRDGLLTAVFDHYGPLPELKQLAAAPPDGLEQTVHGIYRTLASALTRQPAVLPALFADLLARPDGPAGQLVRATVPNLVGPFNELLTPHVEAARLRSMPLPLLVQLLIGPLVSHLLTRRALQAAMPGQLPPVDDVSKTFAEAFLRAAGTSR